MGNIAPSRALPAHYRSNSDGPDSRVTIADGFAHFLHQHGEYMKHKRERAEWRHGWRKEKAYQKDQEHHRQRGRDRADVLGAVENNRGVYQAHYQQPYPQPQPRTQPHAHAHPQNYANDFRNPQFQAPPFPTHPPNPRSPHLHFPSPTQLHYRHDRPNSRRRAQHQNHQHTPSEVPSRSISGASFTARPDRNRDLGREPVTQNARRRPSHTGQDAARPHPATTRRRGPGPGPGSRSGSGSGFASFSFSEGGGEREGIGRGEEGGGGGGEESRRYRDV